MLNQIKTINHIFILLLVLGTIFLFMVEFSFSKGKEINDRYLPLTNTIINIKLELTYSHLWLEEILDGDTDEKIEDTMSNIQNARNLSNAMLNGGVNKKTNIVILPVKNEKLMNDIHSLIELIKVFELNALYRYEKIAISYSGTQLDKEYDTFFSVIMKKADEIELELNLLKTEDLKEYDKLKKLMLFILFFSLFLSSFYVYITQKRRTSLALEIKEKNENLLIAQKELKKSLEIIGENVLTSNTDFNGVITYVSPAFCRLSGYTEKELVGKSHSVVRHPDMPSRIYESMWKSIQLGNTWHGEIKNLNKEGETYWMDMSIFPIYDVDNKLMGYTAMRQDITARKLKEEFMANVSHELRTPLNAIIGFSSILGKRLVDKEFNDLSQYIFTSASSLLSLINNILDLAKIEDGKFLVDPYEFHAYESILNHSYGFDGLVADKDLTFHTEIDISLACTFYGDWERISQIVSNLISNAVKFTAAKGSIEYYTRYEDANLIIKVKDNGIGMNDFVKDRIFKPFEQADGSTTRKYGGTGLGLSITQSLVEMMHGTIEVNSKEGKGTTFIISIPLVRVKNDKDKVFQNQKEVQDKENTLSGHILIAEDNKTNQMLVQMLIEDFGLSCDLANDGKEAVKLYDPEVHALVLMDENMPNMNGLKAMKFLKAKYTSKCGPIVALTANAMKGDRERFLEAGMDEYISKPIDEDELYKVLKKFI
ncbi:MAG: PAS domain S-box-containing protein [Sulfurimonas sp.]|jgi:PAS domain S-box-containing protein|uniref:ATP-binding protein n=1 Tax=Sulfurimonas sp. TaxID=2022749 RepID=UPI0039E58009